VRKWLAGDGGPWPDRRREERGRRRDAGRRATEGSRPTGGALRAPAPQRRRTTSGDLALAWRAARAGLR